MSRFLHGAAVAGTVICASALLLAWPATRHAGALIAAENDPSQLSELQIGSALRKQPDSIEREISQALAENDPELARSLLALASAHGIVVPEATSHQVDDKLAEQERPTAVAKRFATGLLSGEASDAASLSGTVAGDLFVFGDVRDVLREGKRMVDGEEPDRLVLGLATAGLAVTAATFASFGGTTPVRAGLTLVKDARKVGRLGSGLSRWAGRAAGEVVDTPVLRAALTNVSMSKPAEAVPALRAAFRAEKAGALLRVVKDVGRIGDKIGTRGALDTLKIAEGPKDIARAARLAEAQGGKTRAILKLLGRSALLLTLSAFNLSWWMLGVVFALFGFLSSIKAGTERLTRAAAEAWRRRRAAHNARRAPPQVQPAAPLPPMPLAALPPPG